MEKPFYLDPALRYIDTWLEVQFENHDIPGLSVAIAHDGCVLYKRAFGYAHTATQESLTTDHLFRIASHSKTFTAIAIMQLKEAGKLNLDDPVTDYLDFIGKNNKITIKQLLSHGAGVIRDGNMPDFWELKYAFPDKKDIALSCKNGQIKTLETGAPFKYSNFGYALLGLVIEKASNSSYKEYIQENILDKTDTMDIIPEYNSGKLFVSGYSAKVNHGQRLCLPVDIDTKALTPATGFCATPSAVCLFFNNLLSGKTVLLGKESLKEISHIQYPVPGQEKEHYGLGLHILKNKDFILQGHGGCFPGHVTRTFFDPDSKNTVSVFANANDKFTTEITTSLHEILRFFKQHAHTRSKWHKYGGRFYTLLGPIDFIPAGKKIYVIRPDSKTPFQQTAELTHKEGHTFVISKDTGYGSLGEPVTFYFHDKNNLEKVNYAYGDCFPRKKFLERFKQRKQT